MRLISGHTAQILSSRDGQLIGPASTYTANALPTKPDPDAPLILVADDDEDIRDLVAVTLSRQGYRVISASTGDEALKLALEQTPSLAILDLVMPGLYGYSVMRRLKENDATRELPVIVLTARTDPKDVARGLEVGATDYIEKPFRTDDLVARVQAALG